MTQLDVRLTIDQKAVGLIPAVSGDILSLIRVFCCLSVYHIVARDSVSRKVPDQSGHYFTTK